MNVLTIAILTFREGWRQKIFWMALLLGTAFLILYGIGFHFFIIDFTQKTRLAEISSTAGINVLRYEASGMFLILGLYAVNFLIIMMSALTSVATLSGEINSHIIQTIAAKPIRRWQIVIGKLLGLTGMLLLYTLFLAGGLIIEVYLRTGYLPSNLLQGLGLMVLEGLIVFAITFLGGTYLSTLANGVLVFMLYGISFAGSWVEQFGAMADSPTAVQIGIITSLIMPAEACWRLASELMQPILVKHMEFPMSNISTPSPAMVVYALIYIPALMALALRQFHNRDL
jgi:Cu-processing system permease protein